MKSIYTVLLLIGSNVLMTFAWYGHLKLQEMKICNSWPLLGIIAFSWCVAFFEYCLAVPANRIGFNGNGGPYSLMQLKVIQEAISLGVFVIFSLLVFRTETFRLNHFIGFMFLILAVWFIFKK